MTDLDKIRAMFLLPRADACAAELRRSSDALRDAAEGDPQLLEASDGTLLMAMTMEELRRELSATVERGEFLHRTARFLLDTLTESNATMDALYGKTDSMEQAAIELRVAIKKWSTPA